MILTRGLLLETTNLRNLRFKFTDRARTFTFRPLSTTRFTEEDLNRVSMDLPSSRLSIDMMKSRCKVGGTTMISLTKRKKKCDSAASTRRDKEENKFQPNRCLTATSIYYPSLHSVARNFAISPPILSTHRIPVHRWRNFASRREVEQTLSVFHKASFDIIGSLARYLFYERVNLQTIEIRHTQRFPCILKESDRVRRIFSWTYFFHPPAPRVGRK